MITGENLEVWVAGFTRQKAYPFSHKRDPQLRTEWWVNPPNTNQGLKGKSYPSSHLYTSSSSFLLGVFGVPTDSLIDIDESGVHLDDSNRRFPEEDPIARHEMYGFFHSLLYEPDLTIATLTVPTAKRVVYSTCSVHREENEDVVSAVLSAQSDWELAPCFSEWKRRGLSEIPGMQHCIRTIITEDQTIGFFVACFERRSTAGSGVAVKRKEPDDVAFKQQETEASARKKRRKKKSKKSDNTD